MRQFLNGALCALSLIAALFFRRFWRETADRFFVLFAIAFLVLAIHWIALTLSPGPEIRPLFYALRACAFGVIALAILDKNRRR